MKIRFLESIAARAWSYQAGQVIETEVLTPHLRALLVTRGDGTAIAEVVRDDQAETAVAPAADIPTLTFGRRRRRHRTAVSSVPDPSAQQQ